MWCTSRNAKHERRLRDDLDTPDPSSKDPAAKDAQVDRITDIDNRLEGKSDVGFKCR
jgi:hypothetical protein